MPAENPTPITPEGKRAAERVRTIFFAIAAANIVLVAIVMWHRHSSVKERTGTPAKPAAAEEAAARPATKTEQPTAGSDRREGSDAPGK